MTKSNIDEAKLRESIARGIPKPMGELPPEYKSKEQTEKNVAEYIAPKPENRKRMTKSKGEEYISTFLSKREFSDRQLIYVSKDTHRRLSNFVQIVGGDGATLSSYADSILKAHIDENKELINGLFKAHLEFPAE